MAFDLTVKWTKKSIHICDRISKNPHCLQMHQFCLILSELSAMFKEWIFKIPAEFGK